MFRLAGRVTYIFVKLNYLLQNVIHSRSGIEPESFSRPLLKHISSMRIVWGKSAMMKDDICDKRTDHKLSNHSRTCLLAASTVTLCTLSPSVSAQLPLNAALGCHVGHTQSEFTLTGAKVSHIVAKGTRSQHYSPFPLHLSPVSVFKREILWVVMYITRNKKWGDGSRGEYEFEILHRKIKKRGGEKRRLR